MSLRDLMTLIEDHYLRHPVMTVMVGAFAGMVLAALPLNVIPLTPLPMLCIELTGMIVGAVTVCRIGRRPRRALKQLDRELNQHVLTNAEDLASLLRSPRRFSQLMARAWAAFVHELGREAREFGRQYYTTRDDPDQAPPPGQRQEP